MSTDESALSTKIFHGLNFMFFFLLDFTGDKQSGLGSSSNGRSFTDGSRDGARDRRSGTGSGSDSFGEADRRAGYTPPFEEDLDR